MATRLSTASRNAAADAVVDRADAGATGGLLRIYSGAQPATADDAASGTLLVEIVLPDPAFGAAASGVASLSSAATGTAVATGTAGWCRVVDSTGAVTAFDGAVRASGDADAGEELVLDNTSIASGQDVTVNTLTYTQPASE